MTNYTVLTGTRKAEFVVHDATCRDIARTIKSQYPHVDAYAIEGDTVDQAVADDVAGYEAQDQGWSLGDYHIEACCRPSTRSNHTSKENTTMSKTTEATVERFTVTGTGKKWYVVVDGIRDQSVTYRTKTEATQNAADMAKAAAKAERAAKRAAAKAPKPAPAPEVVDYSTLSKTELLKLAKAERVAKDEARKAGTPISQLPATPVLDWMADGGVTAKPRKAAGGSFRTAEQEAQMVDILKAGIAEGKSWAKIALDLDAAQVPTRTGGRWWDATAHSTAQRLGLHTVKARTVAA